MGLWDLLFGNKGKVNELERMKIDELDSEQVRLEAQQEAIISKVKTLESRKDATLREGARKKSDLERKAAAVKYKQLDAEAADYVSQAAMLSKQIRVVGRMSQLKRREALLKQEGLWNLVSNLDMHELEQAMINMNVRAREGDRKATRLLEILEEPALKATEQLDADLQDVLAAMEAISTSDPGEAELEKVKKQFLQREKDSSES